MEGIFRFFLLHCNLSARKKCRILPIFLKVLWSQKSQPWQDHIGPRTNLWLGNRAKCWVFFNNLLSLPTKTTISPSNNPCYNKNQHLAIQQVQTYIAVVFLSECYPDKELFGALQYCHTTEVGEKRHILQGLLQNFKALTEETVVVERVEITFPSVFSSGNTSKDFEFVHN